MQQNYNSLLYSNLDQGAQGTGQRKIVPIFPIGLTSTKTSHLITVDGFGGGKFQINILTFLDAALSPNSMDHL